MVFSSATFIFVFFPAVVLLYKAAGLLRGDARRLKAQNGVLLAASLLFYGWGGVRYLLLLLVLILINWLCGLWMAGHTDRGPRRAALIVGLAADIGALGVCKYFNFIVENIEAVIAVLTRQPGFSFGAPVIPLPIGVSFFTFQIMSYLIDLYYRRVKVQQKLTRLALYVMMFPQLIAGPIVRYADIEQELTNRTPDRALEERGLRRFIMGFAKKALLANQMGLFTDLVYRQVGRGGVHFVWAWLGAICYALQIYMDFSAYSDMAIGLGWFFGFHFNENFNYPYIARSMQEYWDRWHMSLTGWLNSYVFNPLALKFRRGAAKWPKERRKRYKDLPVCAATLITFFISGLWHGAAWQFIVWGLWNGAFVVMEREFLKKRLNRLPRWVQHAYTLLVVVLGLVFFRADTLPAAFAYFRCMFGLSGAAAPLWDLVILPQLTIEFAVLGLLAAVLSMPVYPRLCGKLADKRRALPAANVACWLLLGFSVCYMMGSDYNPFIYFRF